MVPKSRSAFENVAVAIPLVVGRGVANVPVVTVDGGVDVFPVFRSTLRIFGVPEESSTIAFPSETVLAVAIELPFGAVYTVRSEPSAFRATNWFERTRISSPDQVWSLVAAFESVTDCDETVAGVVVVGVDDAAVESAAGFARIDQTNPTIRTRITAMKKLVSVR